MPRQRKDARYMNFYLDESVAQRIDEFSKTTRIPKSRIVEDAVIKYLDERGEILEKMRELNGNEGATT